MSIMSLPVPHDDGHFINERISHVVELIREYDYKLDVRWIPPELRDPGDAAFAIVEHTQLGPVVAFYVQTEDEFDERVLARIYAGDLSKNSVERNMEATNQAARNLSRKKYEDWLAEQGEIAKAIVRSPKDTYKVGDKVFRA